MRYAIVSDIHGNFTALNAVLEDCKNQSIDKYIFLGDYYGEFPMHNEVISKIRELDNVYVIKGNKEERMIDAKKTSSSEWTSEQLAPLYWSLRSISDDNYKYIESLPSEISFSMGDIKFHLAHSPSYHFGRGEADNISGISFLEQFGKYYSSHTEYLDYISASLQNNQKFVESLAKKPKGVYLFGHYHTQWYANINGRLLINPGSCGLPLDFDNSAPYTIFDTDNDYSVVEQRVKYDISIPINTLKESDFYNSEPFWSTIMIMEFKNAKSTLMPFLRFVEDLAVKRNDNTRPYSNELWREAISIYVEKMKLNIVR